MSEQPESGFVPDWTLGWRMQRALAHADVSVEEIAEEIGVSRSTVSRWLNDRGMPPRPGYVKLWALRTGVDHGWLTGDPNDWAAASAQVSAGSRTASTLTFALAA